MFNFRLSGTCLSGKNNIFIKQHSLEMHIINLLNSHIVDYVNKNKSKIEIRAAISFASAVLF